MYVILLNKYADCNQYITNHGIIIDMEVDDKCEIQCPM
jgi:hypothetical protein